MSREHALVVLGARGDTRVTWDLESEEAIREAERIFDEHRARGYAAFRVDDPDTMEVVRLHRFDPEAETILQIPPMAGGQA